MPGQMVALLKKIILTDFFICFKVSFTFRDNEKNL